jgi:glycosyltransferase involved in cell wall biosynthesis
MRIAFVNPPRDFIVASGAQRGSVSIVTWELARRLGARHDVVVYAPCAPGQPFEERGADNITFRRTSRAWRNVHRSLDLMSGMFGNRPPYFTRDVYFSEYVTAIGRWLQRDPPHIVHVQMASQFIPRLRRAVPRARMVLHLHDAHLTSAKRTLTEAHFSAADAIVTCSDYVTRRLREHSAAHAGRISTVGNGVDLEVFHPAEPGATTPRREPLQVLYLGRVSPEKGIHVLTAAFDRVLETLPDARLSIIGPAGLLPHSRVQMLRDDPHAAALEEFYGQTFLDKLNRQILHGRRSYIDDVLSRMSPHAAARVNTAGMHEHTRVAEFYRRANVLVAPSVLPEPFGLPLVEAMASGIPVIATRGGNSPSLIEDGVTGFLVERNDVAALARAIHEVLANPALAARMGHAAREAAVKRFGWQDSVARLEEVYTRLRPRDQAAATALEPLAMMRSDRA